MSEIFKASNPSKEFGSPKKRLPFQYPFVIRFRADFGLTGSMTLGQQTRRFLLHQTPKTAQENFLFGIFLIIFVEAKM